MQGDGLPEGGGEAAGGVRLERASSNSKVRMAAVVHRDHDGDQTTGGGRHLLGSPPVRARKLC